MSNSPIVPIVLEGFNVVKASLIIMGEGDPQYCHPGTIRGDFCMKSGRKICHGSKSIESAAKAISFWFNDDELTNYDLGNSRWLYDDFSPTVRYFSCKIILLKISRFSRLDFQSIDNCVILKIFRHYIQIWLIGYLIQN